MNLISILSSSENNHSDAFIGRLWLLESVIKVVQARGISMTDTRAMFDSFDGRLRMYFESTIFCCGYSDVPKF